MASSTPQKALPTVGALLRRRLREIKRTPAELAEAVEVPVEYIDALIAGTRRPPLPARTDIYPKMTSFLRLAREEIATAARAERASVRRKHPGPSADIRRELLALCERAKARQLERRRASRGDAELTALLDRLLDVTQGAVRRLLDDQISLRLAAADRASSYVAMRYRILEFLDATAETLTEDHLAEFVRPRVQHWDVDLATGVLRVVLRPQEPRERRRGPPVTRAAGAGRRQS